MSERVVIDYGSRTEHCTMARVPVTGEYLFDEDDKKFYVVRQVTWVCTLEGDWVPRVSAGLASYSSRRPSYSAIQRGIKQRSR